MKELLNQIENYKPLNEKEKQDKKVIIDFMKKNENCLLRDNEIAHFTTSGWVVNKKRDKVLMIYHNIYDSWAWVGGHADGDSDLLHVVKKEIEEETGITKLNQLYDGIYGLNIVTVEAHSQLLRCTGIPVRAISIPLEVISPQLARSLLYGNGGVGTSYSQRRSLVSR